MLCTWYKVSYTVMNMFNMYCESGSVIEFTTCLSSFFDFFMTLFA